MPHVNKETRRARRPGETGPKRSRGGGERWVRKNVVVDQRKLDTARRVLRVETETEAIDKALDLVAFCRQFVRGVAAVRVPATNQQPSDLPRI